MLKFFCSYETLLVIKIRDINYFLLFAQIITIALCACGFIPRSDH